MKKIVLLSSNINVNTLTNNIQHSHNEQPEWTHAPFDFIR